LPNTAETLALITTCITALPAPQGTESIPPHELSIDIAHQGRMCTLDGFTPPISTVRIPPTLATADPLWASRVTRTVQNLFAHDPFFPAWACLRQSQGGSGSTPLGAGNVWKAKYPLPHTTISAHARMDAARSLPPGVLAF
jgi:hypothetical protein